MKKIMTLSLAFLAAAVFSTQISNAAIPIKQNAPITTQQSTTTPAANAPEVSVVPMQEMQQQKAKSKSMKKADSSVMPAILYIILAILALGWLAMGINDSFSDFDWLISLILYILFYIPGLIYTLIKMNKYY
ncbi:MAG TPA: YqaE/Pmp3 family membrane protein [Chitinophagaceae bacterium]|nr:YqaE/Pmp3 family membrane protein [Chitinophagaceae bacterium]